jgi:hypothetical protein
VKKPAAQVDHLVIAAESLDQGVQWCEATLGVTPGAGGEHPLMGTHNRVLRLSTPQYPNAYLEIIAINPQAKPPGRTRWFDLDDPELQRAIHSEPRLVHFLARTADAASALKSLQRLGIDRGQLVQAERATAQGLLRWQISVRADGQRLFYGALPTLIQWEGNHPTSAMAESGLALLSLHARHPRLEDLQAAHAAIGLAGVTVEQGPPNLVATLATPKGIVTLESAGA